MNNPYTATTAMLSGAPTDDTYEPSLFSLQGRIGRLRYLAYSMAITLLLSVAIGIIAGIIAATGNNASSGLSILMLALNIPMIIVGIILAKRRLHDLDHSGWLALLIVVPFLNILFILYLMFGAGTSQENRFGLPPSKNSTLVVVGALLLPAIAVIGILAAIAIPAYQDYTIRANNAQIQQARP